MVTTQHPHSPLELAELHQRIGQETGVYRWIVVDQKRIDGFAETTGDRQFIHVDPVRAADSRFGTTIAHGLPTLRAPQSGQGANFLEMKERSPNAWLCRYLVTVKIQKPDQPVVVADWAILNVARPPD